MSASNESAGAPQRVTGVTKPPPRAVDVHKGKSGHVAIVAGSRGMSGAACLSALGALRAGAGLVRVYCPASIQPIVAAFEPSVMTVALREDGLGRAVPCSPLPPPGIGWAHVLALGPGLGSGDGVRMFVDEVVSAAGDVPIVLDADGLNAAAALDAAQRATTGESWWPRGRRAPLVLTPHPGEMQRLRRAAGIEGEIGKSGSERVACAHAFAQATGAVVVLKGAGTVVADGARVYVNDTGNPGMAAGGMGDILTGVLASLMAQGMDAFEAACLAVHVHVAAADMLSRRVGSVGYLAREVADTIPAALDAVAEQPIGFR